MLEGSPDQGYQKGIDVPAMFDGIAHRYDLLNTLLTLGMDRRWRRALVKSLDLPEDGKVLDLACGTGDIAKALLRRWPGIDLVGADPALAMLQLAREKVPALQPVACVAEQLPFAGASFDAVTVAFGVRNFARTEAGLAEIGRVLKPGGQLAVLEFALADRGPFRRFFRWFLVRAIPGIGGALSRSAAYRYLPESIARFSSPDQFLQLLAECGITGIKTRYWLGGTVWLYTGRLQ